MNFDLVKIFTLFLILFAVIDVIGSVPIFVDLKSKTGKIESIKATIASGIIMIAFLFVGEKILLLIGIDISSFAIAGSLILFFLALEMILGIKFFKEEQHETASYVPIAFPLIAGSGTLTTLLSLRAEYKDVENIIAAILLNLVFVFLVLNNVQRVEKILGQGGISILRKVFGVIALALAVKLFRANTGI